MSDDSDQSQCQQGVTVDVELDAARALADMASVVPGTAAVERAEHLPPAAQEMAEHEDERDIASTRLSLELGKVGLLSSSFSSSSDRHPVQAPAAAPSFGPRPRQMLTEAKQAAKRLRRVLANRESARQTILRRQAIRDDLARKVADLSLENENMKKEKEMVTEEYLSLKETNKQLKEQVAKMAKKPATPEARCSGTASPSQQAEIMPSTTSPPSPVPPNFLYTAAPPAVPVPFVWGSWPPCGPGPGYEHGSSGPPLCLPPCTWYYPVAHDPQSSPSYAQPFHGQHIAERDGSGGSSEAMKNKEESDEDPCLLTLAIDVDKRSSFHSECGSGAVGLQGAQGEREEKAATAAEARKRRKELTKLKQTHAGGRQGGEQW